MKTRAQPLTVKAICIVAGASLLATAVFLAVDPARTRAAASRQALDRLEEAVKSDPSLEQTLVSERDRHTGLSLRAWSHVRFGTLAIAVSAVGFLVSAKLLIGSAAARVVSLPEIRRANAPRKPALRRETADLRRPREVASDALDCAFVDDVVAREGRSPEAAIPILQAVQNHYGYLPDEALKRVCAITEIRPSQISGVSTFYAQFRRTPVGRHTVKVCHGTACHVSGAKQITEEIRRHLAIAPDADTDADRLFTIDKVACLGCCSLAPVMMIDDRTIGRLVPASACAAVEDVRSTGGDA